MRRESCGAGGFRPGAVRQLVPVFMVLALSCASDAPGLATPCVVDRVADGDSFRCDDDTRVRLIGIDAPELDQGPIGREARAALRRLMPAGDTVWLEQDVVGTDQYGRILAYVWLTGGDTLVNERMLDDGWAVLYTVPPNVKYADLLRKAANEARTNGTGLWQGGGFDCLPSEHRRGSC